MSNQVEGLESRVSASAVEGEVGRLEGIAPVTGGERSVSIDAVRGLAVLGILVMNIPNLAIPDAYVGYPNLPAENSSFNLPYWFGCLLLFEGKMRCLFSMLFGAGCVLLTTRADLRGAASESADIYYRRMIVLMLIGLLHAYLLWYGDILFWYGSLGMLLFPFRKLSATALLVIGLLLTATFIPQGYYQDYKLQMVKQEGEEAEAAAKAGQKLTEEQTAARQAWEAYQKRMKPPTEKEIEKQIKEYQGDYFSLFKKRAKNLLATHAMIIYQIGLPDVLGFMFIGMAFFKFGLFTAQRSTWVYIILAVLGYGVGVPLTVYFGKLMIDSQFARHESLLYFHQMYGLERLGIAMGHTCVVMLLCRHGMLTWLTSRLAAVGQMALTNYLMQTVICTTLFYGYGLGLYGKLQLYQLGFVVLAIWLLQLLLSPLWLRYFRFGPVEWLWRSLTYLQWQRMGKKA